MRLQLALVVALAACTYSEPADVSELDGTRIVLTSGDAQSGVVGSQLPAPLVVTALDADGNAVADLTIELAVTAGGGTVSTGSIRTDVLGNAQITYTLGTTPGLNQIEVRTTGLGLEPLTFTAIALVGPTAKLEVVSGDAQSAVAGSTLAAPLVVRAGDAFENPVPGVQVEFAVVGGNGAVSAASVATDVDGRAQTDFTLATTAGTNTVEARAAELTPVVFTAEGLVGAPAVIVSSSGDSQSATAGAPVSEPLVVTVQDANGNGVAGHPVAFVVTAGGGSVATPSATTGADGRAQTAFTLGSTAGINRIEARAAGLTGSPVVFTASGTVGTATKIELVSGNAQTGTVNTTLPQPLVVRVTDATNNPIQGFLVAFEIATGNGQALTQSASTNAQGLAQTAFRLGTIAGANSILARAAGLSGSPRTFAATGNPGPASKLLASQGNKQLATIGIATAPLVATVTDAFNNPISGIAVSWVVTQGNVALTTTAGTSNASGQVQTGQTPRTMQDARVEARATGLTSAVFSTQVRGFRPKVDTAIPLELRDVLVADINRDGKPDLVIGSKTAVSILLNTTVAFATSPTFAPRVDLLPSTDLSSIAVGDLNGDGKPDIIAAGRRSGACSVVACTAVLINATVDGSSTPMFVAAADLPSANGSDPRHVGIADINVDGRPEILVGHSDRFFVYPNLNGSSFGQPTPIVIPNNPTIAFLKAADLNRDGRPDIIVNNASGINDPNTFVNTTPVGGTTPSFAQTRTFGGGIVTDVDHDDTLDLINLGSFNPTIDIRRNTTPPGSVTLSFAFSSVTEKHSRGLATDLNGDAKPELVSLGNPDVFVLLNTTSGTTVGFGPSASGGQSPNVFDGVDADFNADGTPDLALLTVSSVSILIAE
jgi:adhesin/invasin